MRIDCVAPSKSEMLKPYKQESPSLRSVVVRLTGCWPCRLVRPSALISATTAAPSLAFSGPKLRGRRSETMAICYQKIMCCHITASVCCTIALEPKLRRTSVSQNLVRWCHCLQVIRKMLARLFQPVCPARSSRLHVLFVRHAALGHTQ